MAYTRSMGQQPWWFQLLAAGSDESDDEDFVPPVQQQRLVRQRAVEPVPREAAYESDTDESIDITHTSDESESESEHESDDDGFITRDTSATGLPGVSWESVTGTRFHPCCSNLVCSASKRSRSAALRCCSDANPGR